MKIIRYVLIFSAHKGKAYLILYVYPHFTFKKISSFYRSRQHFDFVQWRYLTCLCQIWICNGSQGWQIGQEFQFVWSAIQLSPQHSWDAKALLIRKAIFDFWTLSFLKNCSLTVLLWTILRLILQELVCDFSFSALFFILWKSLEMIKTVNGSCQDMTFFFKTQSRIVIFLFLFGKY